jgi:hypothetical protein
MDLGSFATEKGNASEPLKKTRLCHHFLHSVCKNWHSGPQFDRKKVQENRSVHDFGSEKQDRYRVCNSSLSISGQCECPEDQTTVSKDTPRWKPTTITFECFHRVYAQINNIFQRASPFIGDRTFRARMYLESMTLDLAMNHLGAIEIHPQINKILGEDTLGYSIITRYLEKQSFPNSSEVAEEET